MYAINGWPSFVLEPQNFKSEHEENIELGIHFAFFYFELNSFTFPCWIKWINRGSISNTVMLLDYFIVRVKSRVWAGELHLSRGNGNLSHGNWNRNTYSFYRRIRLKVSDDTRAGFFFRYGFILLWIYTDVAWNSNHHRKWPDVYIFTARLRIYI